MSDKWKNDCVKWREEFLSIPKSTFEKFPKEFRKMLTTFHKGFLMEQCKKANPKKSVTTTSSSKQKSAMPLNSDLIALQASSTPIESILTLAKTATSQSAEGSKILSNLADIYKLAIANGYTMDNCDSAPIVDFSTLSRAHLQFLYKCFLTDVVEDKDHTQLYSELLNYVPREPYDYLSDTATSSATKSTRCSSCQVESLALQICVQCGESTCNSCPQYCIAALYGYGSKEAVHICPQCLERFYRMHANKWMSKASSLIESGGLQDVRATFGCVQIALSLYENVNIKPVIRQLIEHNLPELALPIAIVAQQESVKTIEKVKTNRLLSSTLKALANKYQNMELRQFLLTSAKEACSIAKTEASRLDSSSADTHSLQSDMDELNEKLKAEHKCRIDEKRKAIEKFWAKRDIAGLINYIKLPSDFTQSELDLTLEALKQFLQSYVVSLPSIVADDRYALIFFQGVLKIYQQQHVDGMSDIEDVIWSNPSSRASSGTLTQEGIQILLSLTGTDPSIFALEGLINFVEDNQHKLLAQPSAYTNCVSSRESQLLLGEKEITPPFKENWPEFSKKLMDNTDDLKVQAHKQEEKFERNLQEKKWGYRDMAFAYVDYVHDCEHLIERAIALLHASMWFLRDFKSNYEKMNFPDIFANKNLIFRCLRLAHMAAQKSFHPGMQLHVGRVAIAIALETLQLSTKVAVPGDTKLLSYLLHMVTYSSRFVPFWNTPSIPVSEAFLLNISSGEIHSQYLNNLLLRDPEDRPMTEAELHYQIYENDIHEVSSVEDPQEAHNTAMNELLLEKKWTVSDVEELMTSPLSPRDDEGWLIQQPKLGIDLEFAEIKGMILHLNFDNPSIELVVVPASEKRCGTVSQKDFRQVVSMVLDKDPSIGGLFFSLEQPDGQKRFHPFQEFLYSSTTLHKTALLHTMFETDYLLKSFSIGTEVSSKPPFKQRLNTDGLTKKLPPSLQDKIKPVSERGATFDSKAHRFWIQAKKIDYSKTTSGPDLEIRLGEMDMIVRSHPMVPDKHGKLKDTKEDDDPNSPEAKFAQDMTLSYEKLGEHFPMFSRLKQLAKLQVLGLILRRIMERDSDMISLYSEQYLGLFNMLEAIRLPSKQIVSNPCKWVPAALRKDKHGDGFSLCYGGVLITPKITEGIVGNFPRNCKNVPIATYLGTTSATQANAGNLTHGPHSTSMFRRSIHTSASSLETSDESPWSFTETRPETQSSELASEVLKLYENSSQAHSDHSTGGSGTSSNSSGESNNSSDSSGGSNDSSGGSDDSNGSRRYATFAVAFAGVLVSCKSVISKIVNFLGDKRKKTEDALQEVIDYNPHCTRKLCTTCVLKRIPTVVSFTTADGRTHNITEISRRVKNAIYMIRFPSTRKCYIGKTEREVKVRSCEHLRDVFNKCDKTVAKYFHEQGFDIESPEEYIEIAPLGYLDEKVLSRFTKRQQTRIIEFVEGQIISLFSEKQLINRIKEPCKSLDGLGLTVNEIDFIKMKIRECFNYFGGKPLV